MSLLPQQIIPQQVPFGTVRGNKVIIDKDWWLLIYQLCEVALGNGSGALTMQLVELALLKPKGADYDRKIADLQALIAALPNPAGRIATLEREVADLKTLLYSQRTL